MFTCNVKIDDKDILKEYINQKATLTVGYSDKYQYDAVEKPFFSNVAMPNSVDPAHPYGVPRKYGVRKAVSAAQVAAFNEFGGGHTPPRPFMRETIRKYHRKWGNYFRNNFLQYPDLAQTMWKLGDIVKGDLSETIKGWSQPPNAPATVMAKGFNNPLVDSGNMSSDFIEIEVNGRATVE